MTAANLSHLALSNASQPLQVKTEPVAGVDSESRFSRSLRRASEAAVATPALAPAGAVNEAAAKERARRALEIEATTPTRRGDGDAILGGLQRLRGVFDAHEARINEALSGNVTDANTLFAVQLEMARYTMLIEVSSKLTGKSTQAFETLLKGQ